MLQTYLDFEEASTRSGIAEALQELFALGRQRRFQRYRLAGIRMNEGELASVQEHALECDAPPFGLLQGFVESEVAVLVIPDNRKTC